MKLFNKFLKYLNLLVTIVMGCLWCCPSGKTQTVSFPVVRKSLKLDPLPVGSGREINVVYDILQDRHGFMWFSTFNGVVRYDGYNRKHFEAEAGDTTALQSKKIVELMEDSAGYIWALSGEGVVHLYDQALDQFQIIQELDGDSVVRGVNLLSPQHMLEDSSGTVWMQDGDGLLKFQKGRKNRYTARRYRHVREDNPGGSNAIYSLLEDSSGRLWLGTENGLSYYDAAGDRIVRIGESCEMSVLWMLETPDSQILLGSYEKGLCVYDPQTNTSKHYSADAGIAGTLAGNGVNYIVRDGGDNIWLFAGSWETFTFSLQRFDPRRGFFESYFQPFPPSANRMNFGGFNLKLFVDQQGHLWVVTGRGVFKFDPYREVFTDYSLGSGFDRWELVRTLGEDKSGTLWLSVVGEGLLKHSPSTQKFEVFRPSGGKKEPSASSYKLPAYVDSKDYLWLGTLYGTRRYTFDSQNQLYPVASYPVTTFRFNESATGKLYLSTMEDLQCFDLSAGNFEDCMTLPFELGLGSALALIDREGGYWFPARGKGLYYLNPDTGESRHFVSNPEVPNSLNNNLFNPVIIQDKEGDIWIPCALGLNQYHPESGTFTTFLDDVPVLSLHEGRNGVLWITTNGQGLYRFDKNTGEHKRYYPKTGYPVRTTLVIMEDDHGMLWISSDVGLIRFEPATEEFDIFDEADGIPSGYFAQSLAGRRRNGEMFFPLVDGSFLRFHPDSLQLDRQAPRTAIVGFKLFNREAAGGAADSPLSRSIWMTDEIHLEHDQNVFALEYTALHFAAPQENTFAYQLEGADQDWIYAGRQRTVNYAGLAPGEYIFRAKAANHDGIWSEEDTALKITIRPPWWRTIWAYLAYALAGFGLIWAGFRWRTRVQRQKLAEQRRLNRASSKFVPNAFLKALGRNNILDVQLGDLVEREVTVVFSDIRDYTTLSESMTPADNFRFVNSYNGRMGPIIQKHRGFVNQYLGDGIMAIFPESPADAVQAAIEMQQELRRYNQKRIKDGHRALAVGTGLHTGQLVMGIIGDRNRFDAATISDTVNTASRIENLTKYYGVNILLSEATLSQLRSSTAAATLHHGELEKTRYLGRVQVKGKKEPVGIYECIAGDDPQAIEKKLNTGPDFEKAMQHFFAQDFTAAATGLEKILQVNPLDHPARLFLKKANDYRRLGVPEDWTGVEVMQIK